MSLQRLKELTGRGTPVIVNYQDGPADSDNNGHYSVAGKVGDTVQLSDPSSRKPLREMPTTEFVARWHDVDKEGRERLRLGIPMRKIADVVLRRPRTAQDGSDGLGKLAGALVPRGAPGASQEATEAEKLAAADVVWLEKLADRVKPKGIKLLYVETGGGHKAQAEALAEAARKRGIPAETLDWKEHFAKGPYLKKYEEKYEDFLHGRANTLGLGAAHANFFLRGTDKEKLKSWVDKNKDQAIVLTMAYLQRPFRDIDHPVHLLHSDPVSWPIKPKVTNDPNRIHVGLRNVLDELGVKRQQREQIDAIPIRPSLLKPAKKSGLLSPKAFNVTVSGGSMGAEVPDMTAQVLQSDLPENAAVHAVAGKSRSALSALRELAKTDKRLKVHGYAPLSAMMREADLNVVRSHGTTVSETMAAGVPAVFYGPKVRFGFLQDGQGDMTARTAIYAGKKTGLPTAIGLGELPEAVSDAVEHHDQYERKAGKIRTRFGNPADQAIGRIMKARPGYVVKAAAALQRGA
jgi:UDP-N-acetylglucosamine:LPS N-acetylglucosamine transferase